MQKLQFEISSFLKSDSSYLEAVYTRKRTSKDVLSYLSQLSGFGAWAMSGISAKVDEIDLDPLLLVIIQTFLPLKN